MGIPVDRRYDSVLNSAWKRTYLIDWITQLVTSNSYLSYYSRHLKKRNEESSFIYMYSKFVFIKWNRLNTRKEISGQEINIIKTMITILLAYR